MKKTKFILAAIIILCSATVFSQNKKAKKNADKETLFFRYEIECMGVGTAGTYLVKVWSYSKKPEVALEQAKKNAIHGIIFKGFGASNACRQAQKPMATSPTLEHEQAGFFKTFFKNGGDYMKYVATSEPNSRDVLKIGKEYKVGVVVSIFKDNLRKDLETAGILKGLNTGF